MRFAIKTAISDLGNCSISCFSHLGFYSKLFKTIYGEKGQRGGRELGLLVFLLLLSSEGGGVLREALGQQIKIKRGRRELGLHVFLLLLSSEGMCVLREVQNENPDPLWLIS